MIIDIVNEALGMIQSRGAPYRTGDLLRSFHIVDYMDGTYGIRTECEYMVYTNEEWINRDGKNNPHQYWFDMMALQISEMVAQRLGGVVYVVK